MAVRSLTSKPQSFLPSLNLYNGSISHLLPFGGGLQKRRHNKRPVQQKNGPLGCVRDHWTRRGMVWYIAHLPCPPVLSFFAGRKCFFPCHAILRPLLFLFFPRLTTTVRFFLTFFLLSEEKSSSFSSSPPPTLFPRNSAFFFLPHLHKKRRGEEALEKGRGRRWRRERGEGKGGE